jgi:hypothetical protein
MDEPDGKRSPDPPAQHQIPIRADDAVQAGTFANLARISHGADSFLVDFLIVHADPPFGRLQARVILTPAHAKRLARALQDNLERYERSFGVIPLQQATVPPGYVQ